MTQSATTATTQTPAQRMFVVTFRYRAIRQDTLIFSEPLPRAEANLVRLAALQRRDEGQPVDSIELQELFAPTDPVVIARQLADIHPSQVFAERIGGRLVRFVCSPMVGAAYPPDAGEDAPPDDSIVFEPVGQESGARSQEPAASAGTATDSALERDAAAASIPAPAAVPEKAAGWFARLWILAGQLWEELFPPDRQEAA